MVEEILKTEAFKLKGRLYTLTVLNLLSSDIDLFLEQLESTVASAPRLFDNTPVILDCSLITDSNFDLLSFCQSLRKFNMVPIAIQGGNSDILNFAKKASLPVLFASTNHDKSIVKETKNQQEEVALEVIKTKLLSQPVRSGQQIASKEGDLVIVSSVSHGAELLADGNIHVYGALRGRALAGIGGNKEARIFCQSLDAELVAIAGIYCLSESMPKMKSPCQIFLKDDKIQIENL